MPTEITITIQDEALPKVQEALDKMNNYRTRATMPTFTLQEFIQADVEQRFGITAEQLAADTAKAERQELIQKIDSLTAEERAVVLEQVDTAISSRVEPIKDGGGVSETPVTP